MILIVNRMLIPRRFNGWVFWPFIFVRHKQLKRDRVFLNHERIHLRQQIELLVLPFFLWYGLEFLLRLIQYRNAYRAYRNISFEREAYDNENDLEYTSNRPVFSFTNYL